MQCQASHWIHGDQEDGPALDEWKGDGIPGGGVLVKVLVGRGWGGEKAGLASRSPGRSGDARHAGPQGRGMGPWPRSQEPQGTSRLSGEEPAWPC